MAIPESYPTAHGVALARLEKERRDARSLWKVASDFEPAYVTADTRRDYAIAAPRNSGKDENPWEKTSTSS
jgi:hypothetical protein